MILDFIILTEEQKNSVEALNDSNSSFNIEGRLIDNPIAGSIYGLYAYSANILNDPNYERFFDFFSSFQAVTLDSDSLFQILSDS